MLDPVDRRLPCAHPPSPSPIRDPETSDRPVSRRFSVWPHVGDGDGDDGSEGTAVAARSAVEVSWGGATCRTERGCTEGRLGMVSRVTMTTLCVAHGIGRR